ncbi:MAG: 5'/3'-nucleotidase SurE, partial [Gammaproteobacteria bacterium]
MQPLILVTNDDGIRSAGLRAAAEAASTLGDVLIVAPKIEQTGMGRSFPKTHGQGVIEVCWGSLGGATVPYYAVNGSPAQAVAHAVLEIAPTCPALCISGINDGENLGGTNLISGTVGAALEAAGSGIPALAVSIGPEDPDLFLKPYREADWAAAVRVVRQFGTAALCDGLPPEVALLNINIPSSATPETEIRATIQSRQSHYICARPCSRDFLEPFRLPVAEKIDFATLEPN